MPTDTLHRYFSEDSRIDSPEDELRAGATIDIGHCGVCGKPITVELAGEHTLVETMHHSPECPLAKPLLQLYDTPHCVVSYDTRSLCTSGTIHDAFARLYELNEGSRRRKPLWEDEPDPSDDQDERRSGYDQYGNEITYSPDTDEESNDYDELDFIDISID